MPTVTNSETLKEKAKTARKFLRETCKVNVSHSQCLEMISQLFGYKDWNTAAASLKSAGNKAVWPSHLKTVGELKRVLAKCPDSDTIDADFTFKVKEILDQIEDSDSTEDTIHQEFSLYFEGYTGDIVTFKLKLEHVDIGTSTEEGYFRYSLN